jgi:hypothetical protein
MAFGAASLGTLALDVVPNMGGFQGEMKRGIASSMAGIGTALTAAVSLPLAAMAVGAFRGASGVQEAMNKVNVVFDQSAEAILDWSRTSATSLGQSRQQALEAAGAFGNLFTAMGLTSEESATMSMDLVTLASDLASFNNIDPTEALEKLRSGLVGETEPLRSVGVLLNEAAVQAKAMELGLVGVDGELTEAQKVQARYAIILDQTSAAQGDFSRTSTDAANATRIARAQFADAASTMGQHLLPIGTQVLAWANSLLASFNSLTPTAQKVILVVGGLAASIGPLLLAGAALINAFNTVRTAMIAVNIVMAANPFLLVAAAVALLAVVVITNWDRIKGALSAGWAAFETFRDRAAAAISALANSIIGPIKTALSWLAKLNPFSKGSPSLVENVQRGVAEMARAYMGLGGLRIAGPQLGGISAGGQSGIAGAGAGGYRTANITLHIGDREFVTWLGQLLVDDLRLRTAERL